MGDIGSSHSATQKTVNQQVGVNGAGASGSSGTLGKNAALASGSGISLSFNTGGNKISTKQNKGQSKGGGGGKGGGIGGKAGHGGAAGPASASGADAASNQAGGNINVQLQQTDQGAIASGTSVSLAALQLAASANDALLQSNTNAVTLAAHALQAGADVAAVAIPTYAAQEIASNAINPGPTVIDTGGGQGQPAGISKNEILIGVAAIAAALLLFPKRNA
jgi:hypothetical protein